MRIKQINICKAFRTLPDREYILNMHLNENGIFLNMKKLTAVWYVEKDDNLLPNITDNYKQYASFHI